MHGCDQKIRSAAFVQDLMVTTEVRWGYTLEMLGLKYFELPLPVQNTPHSQ
jgi:hypothetical protein